MLHRTALFVLAFFALPAAAEPTQTTAERAQQPTEKLICKRHVETGSLVKRKKECHTRAEWDRIADANRRNVIEIQDMNTSRPGNSQ